MLGLFNKGNKNRPAGQQDPKMRAERLLIEYDRIFKCFRTHPYISVKEVFGAPPEKYHFLYRVDGLAHTGKSIESINEHIIEITLPADYPSTGPVCKALTPIFHPNISADLIDIKQLLSPRIFLADLVVRIGELIVYQRYSIDDPLNVGASQWAARNKSILPLSSVNLQYILPKEAPVAAPASALDKKSPAASEASEVSAAEATQNLAPDGNAQKTESITIENDSASILDQETPPESIEGPENRNIGEAVSAEDGKRTEAIILEPDSTGTSKIVLPAPESPADQGAAPDTRVLIESIGLRSGTSTDHIKKTGFYCPSCRNKNSRKANFCMYCGTKLADKTALKKARTFFVASMIAVPVIIIGAGISAVFLHMDGSSLFKMFLFKISPSSLQQEKAGPAQNTDSAFTNVPQQENIQKPEAPLPKIEKAAQVDNPSGAKNSVSVPKQRPKKVASEPVTAKKSKIEAASRAPEKAKRISEKSDAQNAPQHAPMPQTGSEQQKPDKINNSLKLAKLYMGIGSYDDAIAQYLDVLMLDPANQEARDGLVKARETKKNTLGK